MRRRLYWIAPLGLLGMAAFVFLGGEAVKLLWNWLAPGLFGWREISFWQAIGLLALCRILFGGLGIRGGPGSNARRRMRQRIAERWEEMTPEEREKARKRWGGRCGPFEPPPPKTAP